MMATVSEKIQAFARSKFASWLLLLGFFYMVAAASHSGSMTKYALRDGYDTYSAISMMDETAQRPFVYRQLLPAIAKSGQKLIEESDSWFFNKVKKLNLDASLNYTRATDANTKGYEYGYRIIYIASFLALFISLILMRSLLLMYGFGEAESILAPTAFVIAIPYIQSVGGFFYDGIELAFFIGAVTLAAKGRIVGLILLTVLASYNKESFMFFMLTLYPFIRAKFNFKQTLAILAAGLLVSGSIHAYLHYIYRGNVGSEVYFQLFINLKAYLVPMTYFMNETTYGLPGPAGFFITTIMIMTVIISRAKSEVCSVWKNHFLIALAINAPLFLAFCVTGELRNLSMLYVGLMVFIAAAIKKTLSTQ